MPTSDVDPGAVLAAVERQVVHPALGHELSQARLAVVLDEALGQELGESPPHRLG